jgi:hypothetical protein
MVYSLQHGGAMKIHIAVILSALVMSFDALGGTIIVSGDSTIAGDAALGIPIGAGNATFFRNVLGSGTTVLIQGAGDGIFTYYNSLPGVTATQTTASSVSSLGGVDVFISILPGVSYSPAEIAAMNSLLSAGGTVFLIGESTGSTFGAVSDPLIDAGLVALGSGMSLAGNDESAFPENAIVESSPLTAGVLSFQYGFTSFVTGGTPLFETSTTAVPIPFVATQITPEPATWGPTVCGLVTLILLASWKRLKRL